MTDWQIKIKKLYFKSVNGKSINRNENSHWEVLSKRGALRQRCMENCYENPLKITCEIIYS